MTAEFGRAVRAFAIVCVATAGIASAVVHTEAGSQSAKAQAAKLPPGEIDGLIAPVALYPDQLLAQLLMSATTPKRVAELDAWLKSKPSQKGSALQDAARQRGFEPSLVALVIFPQVVDFMTVNLDWTTDVGKVFSSDRAGMLDSIQRLRADAMANGKLKSTAQQSVNLKTLDSGQKVIVIEPANQQVVHVPQYNTSTVYTQAPTTTTVVVQEDDDDAAEAMAAGLIGFTAGIAIGAAIDNDYYYGPYGWHGSPYMYNDAWDDYYDHREDAREDWYDNREDARDDAMERREDLSETRSDRAQNAQEQRTERTKARTQTRSERTEARSERSGKSSDAFSNYSSGRSERSASSRGKSSRSSSRSSGRGRR